VVKEVRHAFALDQAKNKAAGQNSRDVMASVRIFFKNTQPDNELWPYGGDGEGVTKLILRAAISSFRRRRDERPF